MDWELSPKDEQKGAGEALQHRDSGATLVVTRRKTGADERETVNGRVKVSQRAAQNVASLGLG
ncbi:hypothetical protein, partial [Marivita sp.]|uniref:hypothetical protein n=1 Tax=Marivita sp. TaxID=2003365 RepID=UPI003F6AFA9B